MVIRVNARSESLTSISVLLSVLDIEKAIFIVMLYVDVSQSLALLHYDLALYKKKQTLFLGQVQLLPDYGHHF